MSAESLSAPRATETLANPFPGLRPFDIEESELFFGRRDNVRELLGRLRRTRFLAVVGASGCGKSSLIKAGLLAALRDGYMVEPGAAWRIASLRPGDEPMRRLARALHAPGALGDLYPGADGLAALEATLRRGSLGLVEAAAEAPLPPQARLFVLVDQFEELFRFSADSETAGSEARAFVKLLIEAVGQRQWPIYVALTMRTDFLKNCSSLPGLAEAINQGLYLVPQMSRAQLRDAIKEPVEIFGGEIAERLINRLLNDLGDDPDQLPILQHALMRIWTLWCRKGREGRLDLDHYKEIGGITEALSNHLEEVYGELDDRGRKIAEWIFRNLTETTEEQQVVRRPIRLELIAKAAKATPEEVTAVAERFRAPGRSFLMPPSDIPLTEETVLDISHESLIRQWKRLSAWAAAEARLLLRAAEWRAQGRRDSLLLRGKELEEAEEWIVESAPNRSSKTVQAQIDYVAASRQASTRHRLIRMSAWILAWILVLSVISISFVYGQFRKAESQRLQAERLREEAVRQNRTAVQQRKKAEELRLKEEILRRNAEAREKETQRLLNELKEAWGQLNKVASQNKTAAAREFAQSYAANEKLQRAVQEAVDQTLLDRRGKIRVEYFRNLGEELKTSQLEYDLRGLGFSVASMPGRAETNAIWFGSEVEPEDVQQIAYLLIRAGIDLQYVGCFRSVNGQERADRKGVVQIGGRPGSVNAPVLSVEHIQQGFPRCEPVRAGIETPAGGVGPVRQL